MMKLDPPSMGLHNFQPTHVSTSSKYEEPVNLQTGLVVLTSPVSVSTRTLNQFMEQNENKKNFFQQKPNQKLLNILCSAAETEWKTMKTS